METNELFFYGFYLITHSCFLSLFHCNIWSVQDNRLWMFLHDVFIGLIASALVLPTLYNLNLLLCCFVYHEHVPTVSKLFIVFLCFWFYFLELRNWELQSLYKLLCWDIEV